MTNLFLLCFSAVIVIGGIYAQQNTDILHQTIDNVINHMPTVSGKIFSFNDNCEVNQEARDKVSWKRRHPRRRKITDLRKSL